VRLRRADAGSAHQVVPSARQPVVQGSWGRWSLRAEGHPQRAERRGRRQSPPRRRHAPWLQTLGSTSDPCGHSRAPLHRAASLASVPVVIGGECHAMTNLRARFTHERSTRSGRRAVVRANMHASFDPVAEVGADPAGANRSTGLPQRHDQCGLQDAVGTQHCRVTPQWAWVISD
jgi:hypothetical protein